MSQLPFDLWSEEAFEFDRQPELFVLLDRDPIVWTIRGARYFGPRFLQVGASLSRVTSSATFRDCLERWNSLEWELLADKIEAAATRNGVDTLAHRCLHAIMANSPEAEEFVARLEAVRS